MQCLVICNLGCLYLKWQMFNWMLVLNLDVSIVDEVDEQLSFPRYKGLYESENMG